MIPILMYHALDEKISTNKYTLTEDVFRSHLRLIAESNMTGISLQDYLSAPKSSSVIISFDDGHVSNLTIAVKVLEEFGFTATFFITTENVGSSPEWLSWADIKQLLKKEMDIQVHGHTHIFLDMNNDELLRQELALPKTLFIQNLKLNVKHMSLPGGRYNSNTIKLAKEHGYKTVSTSVPLLNKRIENNFALLNRFVIHQGTETGKFNRIIHGDRLYVYFEYSVYKLKRMVKRMLGNKAYQKIWNKLMK